METNVLFVYEVLFIFDAFSAFSTACDQHFIMAWAYGGAHSSCKFLSKWNAIRCWTGVFFVQNRSNRPNRVLLKKIRKIYIQNCKNYHFSLKIQQFNWTLFLRINNNYLLVKDPLMNISFIQMKRLKSPLHIY